MSPSGVSRRSVLSAAAVTPAVVATSGAVNAAPAQAAPHSQASPDGARFTFAVLPDIQYLIDEGGSDHEPVRESLRWAVRERRNRNIAFLAQLGDLTEHGTKAEMQVADTVFRTGVDRRLPYSVLAGNHDVSGDDQRGDTPYLRTFGPGRFARSRSYGGSSPDGYNSFHTFDAGGRSWLVLALDWRVSDAGIRWAQRVLDRHPKLPTVLTTHDIVWADESGDATLSDHGRHLWDGLIRGNDQIFLALGGHYWPCGRATLTNDAGNPVHVHITNYQDRYYGGAGMLRTYAFDLPRGCIDVETFSPWLLTKKNPTPLEAETAELTGEADRFSIEIPFTERFAGFAPPPNPPSRPASEVLVAGTAAYWRFDDEGFAGTGDDGAPVAGGAVARDLSGNGNDLVAQRLHDGPAEVLTWSADHHAGAPAHASVRFDGGKNPDRGAVLHTRSGAPVNTATFTRGYTIETFFRLPEPFEGDHAWMGILSWEGRAGDAGKDGGYSTDDAVCSLNVTSERFLQYVVYPTSINDDPTCWSHAVPIGRWTHVAIVNDGSHTVVHVDGSPIARNAAQHSRGIATVGKPFAIGGTQSGGRFGQGFYGQVGDTRIVSRALARNEFMLPG
ncbi:MULTISPECIES: LamG-like jellyroll fold domain-containing protein [Prauserella salsuginis group]|uniref:LamG-like jellyroll fold domain-containing protein n=1 Tax=Prauserella salsuginis TaxID=387889 RepID=A0ABW6G984_9PSEU|nr:MULTISPECIES: LamG-like jellyroll fold domain-containing protein [Prauserella salsuginis group]MCR3719449.1 Concanavalin A-like lectin/glucanases superfamily protein [Prauserella flava]MCR3735537.1 Concanavalin A-like lectin/glucanases superfamily protein [Prauserella salsuginis]